MSQDLSTTITEMVNAALAEDVGTGDVTSADISQMANAHLLSRDAAVVCGQAWAEAVFAAIDPSVELTWQVAEGQAVEANTILLTLHGLAKSILTAERAALNFLQTLSAVATKTQHYVAAVAGIDVQIFDTRKTLPLWRQAQKYAVRVGGGHNQRFGLYDAFLIKENHIVASGGLAPAVANARARHPELPLQVEVETLADLEQALSLDVDKILLDNFSLADLRAAVELNTGRVYLEASGGVTLETVRDIAETGVDGISIGCLTKHIQAVDLSLRFEEA